MKTRVLIPREALARIRGEYFAHGGGLVCKLDGEEVLQLTGMQGSIREVHDGETLDFVGVVVETTAEEDESESGLRS